MPKYVEQTVGERDSSLEARARQLPPELAEEYSDQPKPCTPVQSSRKFRAVFGTTSKRSCMTIRPLSSPAGRGR